MDKLLEHLEHLHKMAQRKADRYERLYMQASENRTKAEVDLATYKCSKLGFHVGDEIVIPCCIYPNDNVHAKIKEILPNATELFVIVASKEFIELGVTKYIDFITIAVKEIQKV